MTTLNKRLNLESESMSSLDKQRRKTLTGLATMEWREDDYSMSGIESGADIHATDNKTLKFLLTVSGRVQRAVTGPEAAAGRSPVGLSRDLLSERSK